MKWALDKIKVRLFEKFLEDARVPNSALLVDVDERQDKGDEIDHWVQILNQKDVHPHDLVWEKTWADAECRKSAVKYLLKNYRILKAVWAGNSITGLFMACVLREMAALQHVDRPKEFYTCIIECLKDNFPDKIPDFCRLSIQSMKGLPQPQQMKLLALPVWHAESAGPSDPARTTTTSTSSAKPTSSSTSSGTTTSTSSSVHQSHTASSTSHVTHLSSIAGSTINHSSTPVSTSTSTSSTHQGSSSTLIDTLRQGAAAKGTVFVACAFVGMPMAAARALRPSRLHCPCGVLLAGKGHAEAGATCHCFVASSRSHLFGQRLHPDEVGADGEGPTLAARVAAISKMRSCRCMTSRV